MLKLCLALQEAEVSIKVAVLIPPGNDELLLLCILAVNGQSVVGLKLNHSKRCMVVFHCCLICNFFMTNFERIFICLFVNSISGEKSVQIFCTLFNEIVILQFFVW